MKKSNPPIVAQIVVSRNIQDVWNAITVLDEMKEWYFPMLENFKAEVGFSTSFSLENEGRIFEHLWQVIEVISTKKIVYEWRFTGYKGAGFTVWELFNQKNKTKLVLTNVVTEDYPDDIPEFKRESAQGGWDYFIGQSLANYLS